VCGLAALACNISLFASIHRRKSAIFFCHGASPLPELVHPGACVPSRSQTLEAATDVPRSVSKSQQ
jgi:hypothetical protein